ncbi:type I secretion protein TolC [Citrobacter amalonaticus]|uniref:Type I secretion protein TolC n=1 Tax=Citrobacter amalonaticus TaxID=35703 RepID=A0A2S4RQP8_CITAM|nr:TolC family outer membrane protein [Citrobacter amalonaticus]POT56298.1 type I secretion protein TolC [Citrobacter amalonaticus]POT74822.1 type I secretion protein TolC [Citrobacter amalonaticus]POU60071.1 type I secretion protein TolC [Citrobacter amalonaticus]POV02482.1 type I secretion protein TolC [Citrobacter amalonaticus]
MGKVMPVALLLASALCCAGAEAEDEPQVITSEGLASDQTLPSLDGSAAELPLSAAAPGNLTVNDAVNRAVNWHPSIREAIGKLLSQNEQIDVAKSRYYPQVTAGMNNGYSNTYTDHGYSPSLVLSVSQMLYDFGKVSSQVRAETAGAAQQQANVLLSIDTVAHETATAMVQVQTWQQMVDAAEEQLVALNGIGKLTRERNDEGATSLSDVVQTDARIESARSQLAQYQANLDSSKASLMSWLGWNSLNGISNAFPAKLDSSCDIAKPDDRLVPAVLAAWAQANVAQANLDYANAQMTPTISLEPSVQHYLNDKYPSHDVLDKTQYSTWVKVEMPLYQGGGLTARRNAASHAVESAQSTIQRTRLDVRQKLLESRSQAMSLATALQILRRQQQLSERTRELYQQQYLDLGSRPLLDVLNAEQEVYQARFAELQTQSQLRQLQLNCLYNTGTLRQAFTLNNRRIQSVEIQP